MPECSCCDYTADDDEDLAEHQVTEHSWEELSRIDQRRITEYFPQNRPDISTATRVRHQIAQSPLGRLGSRSTRAFEGTITRRRLIGVAAASAVGGSVWTLQGDRIRSFFALSDTWNELPETPAPQDYPAATAYERSVYVFGGGNDGEVVQRYDTEIGEWSTVEPLPEPRQRVAATTVDDFIYVIAGTWDGIEDTVFRYDPNEDEWTTGLARKPTPVRDSNITATDGELIYVPAGSVDGTDESDVFEVYDPEADEWITDYPNLPTTIRQHITAYVDGSIYVIGGESGNHDTDLNLEYNIDANEWIERSSRPIPAHAAGGEGVGNYVFVAGGHTHHGDWDQGAPHLHRYNTETDEWDRMADLPTPRDTLATAVVDNALYTIGGRTPIDDLILEESIDEDGEPMATFERYNL